jgi:hypothetical protein
MAQLRKQPFIYLTWLKNYLIGDDLCRWSIWHRIYYQYEQAKSDFDNVKYNIEHAAWVDELRKRYINEGYEVIPEVPVYIRGRIAQLKGRVDLVALREDGNLIIEAKTGTPRQSDKVQIMLYIWALPKTQTRFQGGTFDGVLAYKSHEIEVSALEIDERFLMHFTQFTKDILSAEPDRKYPSPRECKWCRIADCDERDNSVDKESDGSGYQPDFF